MMRHCALALILMAVGCGDSGTGGAATGGSGQGGTGNTGGAAPADGLEITVLWAKKQAWVKTGMSVMAGEDFVVADVVLANHTGESLQLLHPLFALKTADGVLYPGSQNTDAYVDGCPTEGSLADEGTISCGVVFEVPEEEEFTAFVYSKPDASGTWEAPLPGPVERLPPTNCEEQWAQINHYANEHCDDAAAACDDGAACREEELAYTDCVLDIPLLGVDCFALTVENDQCGAQRAALQTCEDSQ